MIALFFNLFFLPLYFCVHPSGDMIHVKSKGIVGILLDDLGTNDRGRLIEFLKKQNDSFWINRVQKQLSLAQYRLTFRPQFNENASYGQLILPPFNQIRVKFTSSAEKITIEGHDHFARSYTIETYIIGKNGSARQADPNFASIGGEAHEVFSLPVDPQLLIQRTGFACMDEDQFPLNSVDPEAQHVYYDDSCDVEDPFSGGSCGQCHCTKTANESCKNALTSYIGTSIMDIKFKYVKWDENKAVKFENLNDYKLNNIQEGSDVIGVKEGFKHSWIVYRYFSEATCERRECLDASGWRRLFLFDAIHVNVGNIDLHIGEINYVPGNGSSFIPQDYHNLYYWFNCHNHPHFSEYAKFTFDNKLGRKQGFCMQTTSRNINHRNVSIVSPYWNCSYQGIAVGWSDNYNGGIPCQWIDITSIDTGSTSVTSNLTVIVNPKNWLCEGIQQYDSSTHEPVFVSTEEYTTVPPYKTAGQSIEKWGCQSSVRALQNNVDIIPTVLPTNGHGYLTSKCLEAGQIFGSKRDCEFHLRSQFNRCTQNKRVVLQCSVEPDSNPQVLRVCESSIALQTGTACRFNDDFTLANIVISPGVNSTVEFKCPGYRDDVEIGGYYSTYNGAMLNGVDDAVVISCIKLEEY